MPDPNEEVRASKAEAMQRRAAGDVGTNEYQSTKHSYTEVQTRPELIALRCHCGQIIKKRRDSFLPGMHVAICLACGNISSEIVLLDGATVAVTAESHRDGAGG